VGRTVNLHILSPLLTRGYSTTLLGNDKYEFSTTGTRYRQAMTTRRSNLMPVGSGGLIYVTDVKVVREQRHAMQAKVTAITRGIGPQRDTDGKV